MRTIASGIRVDRYQQLKEYTTRGDPFDALLVQLGFLTSREFVADVLSNGFGISPRAAEARARRIVPHVHAVLSYAEQARHSPIEVSFLPSYYAALNLLKLYVLFGARYAELSANRWHGAQYQVEAKDSRNLLTEEIHLKANGAIQLFYESLTGSRLPTGRAVSMGDVYPYIADVSAEYEVATGRASRLVGLECSVTSTETTRQLEVQLHLPRGIRAISKRQLAALRGVRPSSSDALVYQSAVVGAAETTPLDMARAAIDPLLVYQAHSPGVNVVALSAGRIKMIEELPIALALFHMSSVVRYKPEFLARLRDSRHWPLLAALANDGLFRLTSLFWSFASQATVVFTRV